MVNSHLHEHYFVGLIISLTIVMAAAAKSAQFPFSSWLPRAMEGPTPSSAIFYGSVAVHIGVFLLLRTYPFWSGQIEIKILVISIGIITAVLSSITAKVMSTVKAQIAYSSTAQIGLIFIEVALGWDNIALIHLSGNAFLRAYQLLISPSIVTYLIREQFFNFKPKTISQSSSRFKNSLYIIAMNEFKLDDFMYKILWTPLKKIGNFARFMNLKITVISTIALFIGSIILLNNNTQELNLSRFFIPEFIGFIAVIILLRSFVERKNAFKAWNYIFFCLCWIVIAIGFNESFNLTDTLFYFGRIVPVFIFGLYFLKKLKTKETFDLNDFYGHSFEHKWLAFGFLLSSLALIGFPITTTFLGEDLLFTHIKEDQFFIATCVSVCYIVEGIAAIRIYSRIFLGPHKKSYHPVPLRDA
jgi:NADH-quinone oxidoreductase subunit L